MSLCVGFTVTTGKTIAIVVVIVTAIVRLEHIVKHDPAVRVPRTALGSCRNRSSSRFARGRSTATFAGRRGDFFVADAPPPTGASAAPAATAKAPSDFLY